MEETTSHWVASWIDSTTGETVHAIIASFAVSGYASTEGRQCKPFNSLLGDTYEADDPDKGLCFFSKRVKNIAERFLKWVMVEGYIFFAEPCYHQSEDHKQKSGREHIREPRFYTKVFNECHVSDDVSGSSYEFSLVETRSIGASGDNKINENQ
ncbi:phosphoethanolamine N-methyltransferase, partial [Tanacetum coccineum]